MRRASLISRVLNSTRSEELANCLSQSSLSLSQLLLNVGLAAVTVFVPILVLVVLLIHLRDIIRPTLGPTVAVALAWGLTTATQNGETSLEKVYLTWLLLLFTLSVSCGATGEWWSPAALFSAAGLAFLLHNSSRCFGSANGWTHGTYTGLVVAMILNAGLEVWRKTPKESWRMDQLLSEVLDTNKGLFLQCFSFLTSRKRILHRHELWCLVKWHMLQLSLERLREFHGGPQNESQPDLLQEFWREYKMYKVAGTGSYDSYSRRQLAAPFAFFMTASGGMVTFVLVLLNRWWWYLVPMTLLWLATGFALNAWIWSSVTLRWRYIVKEANADDWRGKLVRHAMYGCITVVPVGGSFPRLRSAPAAEQPSLSLSTAWSRVSYASLMTDVDWAIVGLEAHLRSGRGTTLLGAFWNAVCKGLPGFEEADAPAGVLTMDEFMRNFSKGPHLSNLRRDLAREYSTWLRHGGIPDIPPLHCVLHRANRNSLPLLAAILLLQGLLGWDDTSVSDFVGGIVLPDEVQKLRLAWMSLQASMQSGGGSERSYFMSHLNAVKVYDSERFREEEAALPLIAACHDANHVVCLRIRGLEASWPSKALSFARMQELGLLFTAAWLAVLEAASTHATLDACWRAVPTDPEFVERAANKQTQFITSKLTSATGPN